MKRGRRSATWPVQSRTRYAEIDLLEEAFHQTKDLVDAIKLLALGLESTGIEAGSALFAVTQSLAAQVQTIGSGLKSPVASFLNSGKSRLKGLGFRVASIFAL